MIKGLVILQVEDWFGAGTKGFLSDEEAATKKYKTNGKFLTDTPTKFNGIEIWKRQDWSIRMC